MQLLTNGLRVAKFIYLGAFTILFILLPVPAARAAILTHRYSFDTDVADSINGANGTLLGNALISNGTLVLDGTNSSAQLPNDLFTNYDSISFEIWYADAAVSNPSNQLYHFYGPQGGMSYVLWGQGSHVVRGSTNNVTLTMPAVGGTNHLIWVEDATAQTAQIYVNGILAASLPGFTNTPTMIGSTTTNYLGAGATNILSSNFKGNILEFRTYQGALSPLNATVLDAFGPDHPQTDPGALQSVRIVTPSPAGPGALFRAGVFADFANITNVNISTQPDLVLTSDNPNIISIASDLRLLTKKLGTANITAIWQGFSNTVAVAVVVPQDIALAHRYDFNEQTNDWIVHDSVGKANGRVFNTGNHSPTNAVFTGNGEMKLSGGYYNYIIGHDAGGYATLPPGIISSLSEVTIEAWVTWTPPSTLPLTYGYGAWQRIFDFGSQSGGQGISYLFLTPATDNISFTTKSLLHTAITTNLNVNETPRLNWTNALPTNVLVQVVVAYSPVRGVMKMYLNGVAVSSGKATIPLSGIVDTNCLLGKSPFAADAYFYGRYHEFRIYSGLLSDADVSADYAAGPNAIGVDYVLHGYLPNNLATNCMTVSWGPSATNLALQASPILGSNATWSQAPDNPTLQNGRYTINVPFTNSTMFFRLHAP